MRPIFWGLILCIIGALGWVVFTVVAVITLGTVRAPANFFGLLMAASLPVAAIVELGLWIRRRTERA